MVPSLAVLPNTSPFVQISSGSQHSLLLTENGLVYSCGSGGGGRLGHNSTQNQLTPKLIETLMDIVGVSAGHDFSLVVNDRGTVYSFGVNLDGRKGLNIVTGNTLVPKAALCGEGYSGDSCDDWSCFSVVHNNASVCSGHGQCNRRDRCSCLDTHHGLKCQQTVDEQFDLDTYSGYIQTLKQSVDIVDAIEFFVKNHRVCRSESCKSENTLVEEVLKRVRDDEDEGLSLTETIDFMDSLSNSSFSLTSEARDYVVSILERENCLRKQTVNMNNHVSKYFNLVNDWKLGFENGIKLMRCLATTLRRNEKGKTMDVAATKGSKMIVTTEKNVDLSVFSIRADSFESDIFIVEMEDEEFGSVVEISGIDENGTILEVNNLDDLISFQIQTNQSRWLLNHSCWYYDEDDSVWLQDGLSKNEIESGFHTNVTCHASHFTIFRVELNYRADQEVADQEVEAFKSSKSFEWWMGLLIGIGVIIFAVTIGVIALGFGLLVHRKRAASKISKRAVDPNLQERGGTDIELKFNPQG